MVRVLATGTFDLLHPGHLIYLNEAKSFGNELYVIVARDVMIKHKPKPIIHENQRLEMIKALKMVDVAILGSENNIFDSVKQIQPDIIALGYDQHFNEKDLEIELKKNGINASVVRTKEAKSCPLCSSAKIVEKILHKKN